MCPKRSRNRTRFFSEFGRFHVPAEMNMNIFYLCDSYIDKKETWRQIDSICTPHLDKWLKIFLENTE